MCVDITAEADIGALDGMFADCKNLEYINLSGINMSNIKYIEKMFWNCQNLKTIIWRQEYDFSNIDGFESMF